MAESARDVKKEILARLKHIEYLSALYVDIEKDLATWKINIDKIITKNIEEIYEILGI